MGRAPYVYQVLEWGTGVRSDDDADARYVTIAGVAKTNTRDSSYAVANEFICARLGTVIGLPILRAPSCARTTVAWDSSHFGSATTTSGPRRCTPQSSRESGRRSPLA